MLRAGVCSEHREGCCGQNLGLWEEDVVLTNFSSRCLDEAVDLGGVYSAGRASLRCADVAGCSVLSPGLSARRLTDSRWQT